MQRNLLQIALLFLSISPALAEEPYQVPEEYQKQIMERNRPAVEKYLEANPEVKKSLEKDAGAADPGKPAGQPGEPVQAPADTVTETEKTEKLTGSRAVADEAFQQGDYETALKHYKALAEEGDGEASLTVGIMYSDGLGVEKDKSESYAWMKRSAEQGEQAADKLSIDMQKHGDMTEEELARANARIKELPEKAGPTGVEAANPTASPGSGPVIQTYRTSPGEALPAPARTGTARPGSDYAGADQPVVPGRTVTHVLPQRYGTGAYAWAPEKLSGNVHYEPERFQRSQQETD